MGFGIKELVVILVIVLLLFGTKKLKNLGTDLGSAIKGFRNSVSDEKEGEDAEAAHLQRPAEDAGTEENLHAREKAAEEQR